MRAITRPYRPHVQLHEHLRDSSLAPSNLEQRISNVGLIVRLAEVD